MASVGGCVVLTPTPSTTIALTISNDGYHTQARWTAGQNATVNLSGTQRECQTLTVCIINDATPRTITFGTGFSTKGNLVGTANQMAMVTFESNGTKFYETGRITGLT